MKATPEGAVLLAAAIMGFFRSIPAGLVSLGVGLLGVVLARWVFVNREHRATGRRQRWTETLPLTLIACLVAGVIIHDRSLSLSASAFVGLGVGWAAVLLLDIFGDRIIASLRAGLGAGPARRDFPPHGDLSGHGGNLTPGDVDIPDDLAGLLGDLRDVEEKPDHDASRPDRRRP